MEKLFPSDVDRLRQAAQDLKYWQEGGDSFNCKIFELLQKADPENRNKILFGWPKLHDVWTMWNQCESHRAFLEIFDLDD